MLVPCRPTGPTTAALNGVVAAAEREAAKIATDPLDAALLATLGGLRDAMQSQGEDLDAPHRRLRLKPLLYESQFHMFGRCPYPGTSRTKSPSTVMDFNPFKRYLPSVTRRDAV